jgi:hypothetical protein
MVKGYQTDPGTGRPRGTRHYVMEKGDQTLRQGKGKGYQTGPGTGGPDITSWERGTRPDRGLGDQQSGKKGGPYYVMGKGYQNQSRDWGTSI